MSFPPLLAKLHGTQHAVRIGVKPELVLPKMINIAFTHRQAIVIGHAVGKGHGFIGLAQNGVPVLPHSLSNQQAAQIAAAHLYTLYHGRSIAALNGVGDDQDFAEGRVLQHVVAPAGNSSGVRSSR